MARVGPGTTPEGSDSDEDACPRTKSEGSSGSNAGSSSGTKPEESAPNPASTPSASPDGPPASASAVAPVVPSASALAAARMREPLLNRTGEQAPRRALLPSFCHHPLSKQATIAFLTKAADASVMGLVTLNVFYATYLLAWGQPGSHCIPPIPKPGPDGSKKLITPGWVQVVVGSLPFVVFPLTLFVSGLVQAAERDGHALGFVATLCLIEFTAAIVLGGGMIVCMTGSSWMWLVPALVIVVMILIWGFTFNYPECLRKFIWLTCFRQDKVVPDLHNVYVAQ